MQAANKNPPWARSPAGNMDMNQGGMGGAAGMMQYGAGGVYAQGMMQNPGANMMGMQGGVAMGQMGGGMYPGNVVAYPTPRAMSAGAYPAQAQPTPAEQRVFTGTVTKTHNDFGFVDHDVFYQTSVCAKGILPKVNDRVLVEATYNANMPFKWNATRVQVLGKTAQPSSVGGGGGGGGSGYNAVPPPGGDSARGGDRFRKSLNTTRRDERPARKTTTTKRTRSRSKSPARSSKRRDSPPRKRAPRSPVSPPPKYVVRVPRIPLDISEMDVTSMTQRYGNLYIPSDFFASSVRWSEAFPPQYPFSLHNPCSFHIMNKEVPKPVHNDAVLEPPDADYKFSAKVMLISLPTLETLYQKCGLTKSDSKDKRDAKATLHPTRLIKFLVGQKGKGGDSFAIGGPWSPSLDGANPDTDPSVLVKTAIRTTKALTGIDLTPCTQWFRMVEFYYWREGGGEQKSRLETVVLFLPDVWSGLPSRLEWTAIQDTYKRALENKLNPPAEPEKTDADAAKIDESLDASGASEDVSVVEDEKPKKEPTHFSNIDLKTIKVDQLREELDARGLSSKGLRAQLLARLSKCIKGEEEAEKKKEEEEDATMETEAEEEELKKEELEVVEIKDDKKEDEEKPKEKTEEEKKLDEKAVSQLKSRYALPTTPYLIVHPSATARGGKFSCNTATLSLLLDYRITDNKEHSFEIFVFAELFNEMLQRDFGFYIYKTLYTLPERVEEEREKDKDKRKDDKKDDKRDDKKDDAKAEKREDKKEERDGEKKEDKKEEVKKEEKKDDEGREKEKDKDKKRERRESVESGRRTASPARRHGRGVELPTDPYLLLALVYFDTSRCGYLVRRDLQTLFMALGLQLSRSQVKSIMDKVCVKENFSYKSLMSHIKDLANGATEALQDLPLDSTAAPAVSPDVTELEASIAAGNRDLLPVFDDGSGGRAGDNSAGDNSAQSNVVGDSGMVIYKKRLVDVGSTLAALARSEQTRTLLETALTEARGVARTLRQAATTHAIITKNLTAQLADVNNKLSLTRSRLSAVTASSKIFHSTLKTIQSKVEAVVNINFEEDVNDDVEIVNGPTKPESSDDKEVKEEKSPTEEVKSELKEENSAETAEDSAVLKKEVKTEKQEESTDMLQPENMDLDDK